MHASERYTNVLRSILAILNVAAISTVVPGEDVRFDSDTVMDFIRVRVDFDAEKEAGQLNNTPASEVPLSILCECYYRGGGTDDVYQIDGAQNIADQVAALFRARAGIEVLDYIGDSTGATSADAVVQFPGRPHVLTLAPDGGWQRRHVTVNGFYFAQHGTA